MFRIYLKKCTLPGLLLACCLPWFVQAQTAVPADNSVSPEVLEARIQEIEAAASLSDSEKTALLELYQKSLSFIKQGQSYADSSKEFVELREEAPKESGRLRKQIQQIEATPPEDLDAEVFRESLTQLQQRMSAEKAKLSGLSANLTEAEALLEAQSARAVQIRDRLDQAQVRQAEIAAEIKSPSQSGSQRLNEATLWSLQLETRALAAEIDMLNQELLTQPMRVELYGAQREKAALEWDRKRQYVDVLGALVGQRRLSEAESARQEAEEIERQSFGKHLLLQQLAQDNAALSKRAERHGYPGA